MPHTSHKHRHHHEEGDEAPVAPGSVTIYNLPTGCNCANKSTYDQEEIQSACDEALALASEGQTVGRDKYPHVYNDNERFNFGHAQKPFFEFPIMPSGEIFDGDTSPGADRVVIGSVAADYASAVFCAVITHTGAVKHDGFVECKDDTINTDGEGVWEASQRRGTKGRGREAPEGRQHLKPEDVKLPFVLGGVRNEE
ncbi:Ribonuclease/ribotoxin [Roridomyces roridus]|uniref:Ribonuclease/ribotoxin n=1 Tax=Roridomyces roridus TaxID=1738132 RepID=A0AAD7CLS3_9AGAR|nr:Ribonuclease/ribotoxin [Roridomyces roridus]